MVMRNLGQHFQILGAQLGCYALEAAQVVSGLATWNSIIFESWLQKEHKLVIPSTRGRPQKTWEQIVKGAQRAKGIPRDLP